MPFVVQCPYCNLKARVPDRAHGASGKCVRCQNSFTLVPADDQRVPELVGAPTDPSSSDLEPQTEQAAGSSLPEVDYEADLAAAEEILRSARELEEASEQEEEEAPAQADLADLLDCPAAPVPKRVRAGLGAIAGAAALLLGGAGLAAAAFSISASWAWPLAAGGSMVGIATVVLARRAKKKKRRLSLPILGSAASLAVLTIALFFPALLGPNYARFRQTATVPTSLRAVPLRGPAVGAVSPEWADAGKYALLQGGLRVEVLGVSVGPVDEKAEPAASEFLRIRVRVTHAAANMGEAKAIDWAGRGKPTLMDKSGRLYPFKESRASVPVGSKRRADMFPVQTSGELLAFEKPDFGWETLLLELPESALQTGDPFRFSLPASLLTGPQPAGKK